MFRPDPKPERIEKKKVYVIKRTPLKNKRKPTGELAMFREIYSENDNHSCEICNKWIGEFSVANFHHIKPKSKYPELRLIKSNISYVCFQCHYDIHNGTKTL